MECTSTSVTKKIEYLLLVLALSEQECNKLVKKIHSVGSTKVGICRTITKVVQYGPTNTLKLVLKIYLLCKGQKVGLTPGRKKEMINNRFSYSSSLFSSPTAFWNMRQMIIQIKLY